MYTIWWIALGLSLIPFNFGLVFLWRFKSNRQAWVRTPFGDVKGPPGFVVFALGLAGSGLSIQHLAPPALLPDPPTGHVRAVDFVAPRGDRARVRVTMDDERIDVHHGDYLLALARNAPKRLPVALGNLDSDTAALLSVSAVAPGDVKAALASFAADEAAVARIDPVWPQQRVVLIDHDEQVARKQVKKAVDEAEDALVALRRPYLRRVVDLADDFLWDHSSGFFAAEVLAAKGEAHVTLGETEAGVAAYERFMERFPDNPATERMPERIAAALGQTPKRSTMTLAAFRVNGGTSTVRTSDIAVRASSVLPPSGRVDYDAANLLDGDSGTAWSEGASGSGEGTTIRFTFARPYSLAAIRLENGYAKTRALFDANGCVLRMRIRTDRGAAVVRVRRTLKPQRVRVPAGRTRRVELRILDACPSRYRNTMLSGIEFLL
jgi:hypothetical protein